MNRKTIQRSLNKKFSDFIDSIDNDAIKRTIAKHSIITGGAITSMLLGEPVNDYDIYFDSHASALEVAQYYVGKFVESSSHAARHDISIKSEAHRIKLIVESSGVVGVEPSSEDDQEIVVGKESDNDSQTYSPTFVSENAITLSGGIQLIVRFFGDADEIHKNYDFVHCTNYWSAKDGKLTLRPDAVEATLAKELRYIGSKYPLCSVIRTRKFIRRGWNINAGQYLKMCFQVSRLGLTNIKVLQDQLIGVDSTYFAMVIRALQKKGGSVDESYLAEIVDRIF